LTDNNVHGKKKQAGKVSTFSLPVSTFSNPASAGGRGQAGISKEQKLQL
jgi:hypothetical protein